MLSCRQDVPRSAEFRGSGGGGVFRGHNGEGERSMKFQDRNFLAIGGSCYRAFSLHPALCGRDDLRRNLELFGSRTEPSR
jgi:hypothetical protein